MISVTQLTWRRTFLAAALLGMTACGQVGEAPDTTIVASKQQPIINVHLHTSWPGADDAPYRAEILQEMNDNDIVLSVLHFSEPSDIDDWARAEPGRFIASPMMPCPQREPDTLFCFADEDGWPDPAWLEAGMAAGDIGALGEMLFVYAGIAPDDSRMNGYWALAAKYDVPVAVHINRGPPVGAPPRLEGCCPDFNSDIGNPELLRPVLEQYPDLRIYLQHAGIPAMPDLGDIEYTAETFALMRDYPNVYAEMTILNSLWPEEEHAPVLKAFIAEGFADRIMFGTDNLPAAPIIERLNGFDFLTDEQRRGIFYNNAAQFFQLDQETIDRHHAGERE